MGCKEGGVREAHDAAQQGTTSTWQGASKLPQGPGKCKLKDNEQE